MLRVQTFENVDISHGVLPQRAGYNRQMICGARGGLPRPPSPFGLWRGSLRSLRYDRLPGPAQPKLAKRAKAGGARRDRTADLLHAMQALSQLSYGPSTCPARLGRHPGCKILNTVQSLSQVSSSPPTSPMMSVTSSSPSSSSGMKVESSSSSPSMVSSISMSSSDSGTTALTLLVFSPASASSSETNSSASAASGRSAAAVAEAAAAARAASPRAARGGAIGAIGTTSPV